MNGNLGPNEHLIGQTGSRNRILTPSLVLDLDALEHNIATMAGHFAKLPEGMRPHAKTHKSADIAKRQIEAGAVGICCAKLGEATSMAAEGVQNILLTSPIIVPNKIERVVALNGQMEELILAVDCELTVDLLCAAVGSGGKPMRVVVDLGVGKNRTGVPTIEAAVALARIIKTKPELELMGLQCYAGAIQHIEDFETRHAEAMKVMDRIAKARDAMAAVVGPLQIVTGGGTGTFDIDPEARVFTDMQVGSYVFMDVEYNAVNRKDGTSGPFKTSLFVQTTVISANVAERATTDGGFKAFAMDGPRPLIHDGAPAGTDYEFLGDEHGCLVYAAASNGSRVGDIVNCVTPHCDPTVNLYDYYHCVRGDTLVDIWPIQGRGQSW